MIGGAGDAPAADFDLLLPGWKDDIDQIDLAQLLKYPPGFVAQAGRLSHLV